MEPVLELIIKRLDSHPEELNKWRAEIDRINQYLNKEEKEAVKATMRKAAMQESHKRVMKEILGVKEEKMVSLTMLYTPIQQLYVDPEIDAWSQMLGKV